MSAIVVLPEDFQQNNWEELYDLLVRHTKIGSLIISNYEPPQSFIQYIKNKGYRNIEVRKMIYANNVEDTDLFKISLTSLQ